MSDYLYIVFPRDVQPTVDEADALKKLLSARSIRFAIGVERKSNGLTLAFSRSDLDSSRSTDRHLAKLVRRWGVRGAVAANHCAFVKDPAALRPMQPSLLGQIHNESAAQSSFADRLAAQELAGKEAVGRALIAIDKQLDRYAALERLSPLLLCLWVAFGAATIVIAGVCIGNRLTDLAPESRRESTIQAVDDALNPPRRDE